MSLGLTQVETYVDRLAPSRPGCEKIRGGRTPPGFSFWCLAFFVAVMLRITRGASDDIAKRVKLDEVIRLPPQFIGDHRRL